MAKDFNIRVVSKRATREQRKSAEEGYIIVDVTSNSEHPLGVKLSPFYPHGNLMIPGSKDQSSLSVEGAWQGLKVFENEGIDTSKFKIRSMKNIKRSAGGKRGAVRGHMYDGKLLTYKDARLKIYLPMYVDQVLRGHLRYEMKEWAQSLLADSSVKGLVLLDYETNCDVNDTSRPLSHASLVAEELRRLLNGL